MSRIISQIFGGTASKLVGELGGVIDKVVTTDAEKSQLKNALGAIVMNHLTSLYKAQKDVLVAEITGNRLQRNWRPIVMLTFAWIVVYNKFIAPLLGLPIPPLEASFWTLLEIGIGGYVIGRTGEKISERLTRGVDLPFLRKRDRKGFKGD